MEIAYMSLTGQTEAFVNNFDLKKHEIESTNPFYAMNNDFILLVPTYDIEATEIVYDFLETSNNLSLCRGVIGSGNRNFADLYIFTAKDICAHYTLDLLYDFEFRGTNVDIENVKKIIERLEGE